MWTCSWPPPGTIGSTCWPPCRPRLGARRTVAVVEEGQFSQHSGDGGRRRGHQSTATASAVLRFVRTGEVISSALLDKSAGRGSGAWWPKAIAGVPLKDAKPRDAVLGVLVRGGQVIMARGDSVPLPGDLAIVFSATESVPEVERAFSPR